MVTQEQEAIILLYSSNNRQKLRYSWMPLVLGFWITTFLK